MDGATIAQRRVDLGLSQQQLAGLADCSIARLSQIERGVELPRRSRVREQVLAALDYAEAQRSEERAA